MTAIGSIIAVDRNLNVRQTLFANTQIKKEKKTEKKKLETAVSIMFHAALLSQLDRMKHPIALLNQW